MGDHGRFYRRLSDFPCGICGELLPLVVIHGRALDSCPSGQGAFGNHMREGRREARERLQGLCEACFDYCKSSCASTELSSLPFLALSISPRVSRGFGVDCNKFVDITGLLHLASPMNLLQVS